MNASLLLEISGALALFLVAAPSRRLAPLWRRDGVLVASVLALVAGTLLLNATLNGPSSYATAAAIGALLAAFGRSSFLLLWFELLGCLPPAKIAFAYAGSVVLNALLWPVFMCLDGWSLSFSVLVVAIVALAMLMCSWYSIPDCHKPQQGVSEFTSLWKLAVWAGVAAFAYGVGSAVCESADSEAVMTFSRCIPNVVVLLGIALARPIFDLDRIYQIALPALICGTALCLVPGQTAAVIMLNMGEECVDLIFFVVACGLAYQTRKSAVFACATLFFIRSVGALMGRLAQWLLGPALPAGALALVSIMALLLVGTLLFRERDLMAVWDISGMGGSTPDEGKRMSGRIKEVEESFGLSEREAKVLGCLARGMSNAETASELFIAPGTVRAHTSRMYAKMGIHSREELDDLMGR